MSDNATGPVRLGIIGSGLAVKWLHFPALKKLPGQFEIVVACDIDPKAAREVAELAGKELGSQDCSWTTDYKEVLANEAVEAVLLSLPIHLNAQFILEAARAGKHIIAEKPLAANLPQAQELVRTLRQFDHLKIEIAENIHYRADFLKAKEWLQAGRIGTPFLLQVQAFFWTNVNEGFASTPWRQDNQYRGGVLADAGVHHMAALRELGGEVEQLQAFARSVHPVMGGHDTLVLNLRYRNGVIGNLTLSGAAKTDRGGFIDAAVFGSEGVLRLVEGQVTLNLANGQREEFKPADFDNGYSGEFDNFYRAIREGTPVVSTVEETLRDWELVMYALDSAESRSVILL